MVTRHKATGDWSMRRALLPHGWRARQAWRRTARRVVADHVDELLSRLTDLRGHPVRTLAATPGGTVRLMLRDSAITLTEVAASARARLVAATDRHHCYFADGGRYGRFWWVAVQPAEVADHRQVVILGSRLILTSIDDGHPHHGAGVSPQLAAF